MRGLSTLLFDDGKRAFSVPPRHLHPILAEPPDVAEDNDIQKTLGAIGVKYSHRNDDILQPSRIEEERLRDALKVGSTTGVHDVRLLTSVKKHKEKKAVARKRKASGSRSRPVSRARTPDEDWPPKRKHHKVTLIDTNKQ